MIENRQDLKHYLSEDSNRYDLNWPKPSFKDFILKNENWYTFRYIRLLRYVEYFKNTHQTLLYLISYVFYRRLGAKIHYSIVPNTVGPGFIIYHIGDKVNTQKRCIIGKNLTMRPGCIFANKNIEYDQEPTIVGDNCTMGWGVKVIGSVKIGDNVTIGAHAVVTKDVPSNCVIAGIPAKIIRFKQQ